MGKPTDADVDPLLDTAEGEGRDRRSCWKGEGDGRERGNCWKGEGEGGDPGQRRCNSVGKRGSAQTKDF